MNDDNLVINEENFDDVFLRKDVLKIIVIKIKSEWAKFLNFLEKHGHTVSSQTTTYQIETFDDFKSLACERIWKYQKSFYGKTVSDFKVLINLNIKKRGIIACTRVDEQRKLMSRRLTPLESNTIYRDEDETQLSADDLLNIPPFYDISESERRMDIFNILKKLDSNCRKIIELAWLKELNNAQVAEKLNIHRNTVISRLKSCMEMAAKIGIDENGL